MFAMAQARWEDMVRLPELPSMGLKTSIEGLETDDALFMLL